MSTPLPIAVLISGYGSNLQAIIDAINEGTLNAQIKVVISNKPDAFGLTRAREANIATTVIEHQHYTNRQDFDKAINTALAPYQPRLIVLAGFMRVIGPKLLQHYPQRIINTHPSLLPKYPGLHTYQRAIDAGDSEHGVSVHIVTEELDAGPVIGQSSVPIYPDDTPDTLKQRTQRAEHQLLPRVIGELSVKFGDVSFSEWT